MKRALLLALSVVAAAFPASAGAASWQGIVVAKEEARKAVVTASPSGLVRTVRTPSRINALRIGQRLSVRARPLADGTFASQEIRILGRAKQARVRAVVVKYQRALKRYLVSAGGSVFALRTGSARSLASSAEEPPPAQPGTEIVATVNVSGGTAQAQQVSQVGRVGKLELEGILLELSASSLRLVVARAGFVNVTIPAGLDLSRFKVFDQVSLVVAVGTDGSFTLIKAKVEDDDDDDDEDDDDEEDEDDEDEEEDDD